MLGRRSALLAAISASALSLAGCSIGNLQAANPNVSSPVTYQYTAIGASDAVGFGSSSPCQTSAVTIGPDTEQMPSPVSCPNGRGYVPDIANALQTGANTVILTDLGISGAVIGPTERTLGNTYEHILFGCPTSGPTACVPGDFLSDELPLLPSPINTVTIFAGGNDTDAIFAHIAVVCAGGCSVGQIDGYITADVTNFGADYATLLGTVHGLFPFARIYAANLPNFGLIPRGICTGASPGSAPSFCTADDPPQGSPEAEAIIDGISTSIDAFVINGLIAHGVGVIDLECDTRSYDPNNFYIDGFHPDDAGYKIFGQVFTQAIKDYGAPPPQGNCGVYSQGQIRHPFSELDALHLKHIRF